MKRGNWRTRSGDWRGRVQRGALMRILIMGRYLVALSTPKLWFQTYSSKSNVRLIDIVMAQLVCDNCHQVNKYFISRYYFLSFLLWSQEMSPPMTIHQTNMGHNVCGQCCDIENIEVRLPSDALIFSPLRLSQL